MRQDFFLNTFFEPQLTGFPMVREGGDMGVAPQPTSFFKPSIKVNASHGVPHPHLKMKPPIEK